MEAASTCAWRDDVSVVVEAASTCDVRSAAVAAVSACAWRDDLWSAGCLPSEALRNR